ncbi:MAG: hypothetical protein Q9208_001507 [Pyrenodesmia sp. 3 TL-2023]
MQSPFAPSSVLPFPFLLPPSSHYSPLHANPPPPPGPHAQTESARIARKSFYCDLCQKGYGRINEFEAHEGSYDHLHKKRLKEMKQMSRDPSAVSKARKAEAKDSIIKIKPLSSSSSTTPSSAAGPSSSAAAGKAGGGSGFKKGGFKNAFAPAGGGGGEEVMGEMEVEVEGGKGKGEGEDGGGVRGEVEADTEESGSEDDGLAEGERYDPRRPTGCWEGCPGRSSRVG